MCAFGAAEKERVEGSLVLEHENVMVCCNEHQIW